jgi:hypothetical protein
MGLCLPLFSALLGKHVMGITPLSLRASLEQYTRQATDLVKAYRSGDPKALHCFRQLHPRLRGRSGTNDRHDVTDAEIRKAGVALSHAQCVVARWYGFENWPTLAEFVAPVTQEGSSVWEFESAVEAITTGDVTTLRRLLGGNRDLIRARSTREHHATLLHYVAANGVEGYRQRTPKNAVKVGEILLKAGAEVDADLDYGSLRQIYPERTGSAPLGMVATSVHPAAAGVQIKLLKILLKYGASVDGLRRGWNPLIAALHNGRGEAAAFLAKCGARLDLEAVDAIGHGVLGRVGAQVAGHDQPAAVALRDHLAPDWPAGGGVDLQGGHAPAGHVLHQGGDLGRVGDGDADVAVDGRAAVDQATGAEDARTLRGVGVGVAGDQGLGDDLIAGVADAGDAVGQEERQHFVARHVGIVEPVDEVDVGVDQAGNHELAFAVDHDGPPGDGGRLLGRSDGLDLLAGDDDGAVRLHRAGSGVEHRRAPDHQRRVRGASREPGG